jgi:hypothetical protein
MHWEAFHRVSVAGGAAGGRRLTATAQTEVCRRSRTAGVGKAHFSVTMRPVIAAARGSAITIWSRT